MNEYLSIATILISLGALLVSILSYRLAAQAQARAEEWHLLEESRKQFKIKITEYKWFVADEFATSSTNPYKKAKEFNQGDYSKRNILVSSFNVVSYNNSHVDKRLEDIELVLEFSLPPTIYPKWYYQMAYSQRKKQRFLPLIEVYVKTAFLLRLIFSRKNKVFFSLKLHKDNQVTYEWDKKTKEYMEVLIPYLSIESTTKPGIRFVVTDLGEKSQIDTPKIFTNDSGKKYFWKINIFASEAYWLFLKGWWYTAPKAILLFNLDDEISKSETPFSPSILNMRPVSNTSEWSHQDIFELEKIFE